MLDTCPGPFYFYDKLFQLCFGFSEVFTCLKQKLAISPTPSLAAASFFEEYCIVLREACLNSKQDAARVYLAEL